jgi:hypothetical protein
MTIEQTVEIPADRQLHLSFEIPPEVTSAKARVIVQFPVREDAQPLKPIPKDGNGKIRLTQSMKEELLADKTLLSLTGILHTDMTIDEIRNERLAKHL